LSTCATATSLTRKKPTIQSADDTSATCKRLSGIGRGIFLYALLAAS
jgi:hypothetical protein